MTFKCHSRDIDPNLIIPYLMKQNFHFMSKFLLICSIVLFPLLSQSQSFFEKADIFLEKYVEAGKVNYQAIKQNTTELKSLEKQIDEQKLVDKSAVYKKAFYINAYNILVISSVVDAYPIASPMDVTGFFDANKMVVAGEKLTLNDIENKKLRDVYKDPRLHFVLVCAANGCPKIINTSYTTDNVDRLLDERTKIAINDAMFIRQDSRTNTLQVSEIFKWYADDFGGANQIRNYINQYRNPQIPEHYTLSYYEYDWTLNEKK
jgi:hypothetical protein